MVDTERSQTGNIIRRMGFDCWISKAADTHTECVIAIDFQNNSCFSKPPQFYIYVYVQCLYCHYNAISSSGLE
jgi:hypothetical protein